MSPLILRVNNYLSTLGVDIHLGRKKEMDHPDLIVFISLKRSGLLNFVK